MRRFAARSVAGFVTLFVSLAGDARAADPEFTLVPEDEFFIPDENHSFQVRASDADAGDTVTLSADGLPPGATFTPDAGDPASGTFSWTPASSQACIPYAVDFSATDGTSTTGWTTDLHVLSHVVSSVCVSAVFPDESPTTGGARVTLYGGGFEGDLSVTIAGVDVVGLNRISRTKLTFETPPAPTTGPVSLEVDGTTAATLHYFTPPSPPPVFESIPTDLFVIVGQNLTLPVAASDPDAGDTVSLDASNLPDGASFAPASGNPATSQLTWNPPLGSGGDYVVKFHATDGGWPPTLATVEIHVLEPGAPTRIVGLFPSRGPETGGTHVVMRGEGLPTSGSPSVTLGGLAVTNLLLVNETQLEFDTPPNYFLYYGVSDVDVVVNAAALAGGFHYFPAAPTVSIEDVSLANATDVAFGVDGRPGTVAEWIISDEDLGTDDVTGGGNVVLDGFFGTLDTSLDLSDLADGELTVTVTLTQGSDTSAATVTTAVKDTVPPVLSLPDDITLVASSTGGQAVTYTATADDARDGVVDVTCSPASGSVFPVGTTLVGCSAGDELGNLASGAFSVSLTWSWSGILAPIVDGGTYKLGRVLPLKFGLKGASSGVTDVAATVTLRKVSDGVPGEPMLAEATGNANTGNQFRYDEATGQYTFNLSTKGLTAGTYVVEIDLGDDVTRSFTIGLAP